MTLFAHSACPALRKHNGRMHKIFSNNQITKYVLTYLCIACMRLRKPTWVAPTSVKSFPRWEIAKAIYSKPVCCICAYSLHTNYDNKILSTYKILVTRRKYVKSIWQQFHKKQWLAIWWHHCTAFVATYINNVLVNQLYEISDNSLKWFSPTHGILVLIRTCS